ncbi:MAG: hypothetical protein ACXW39_09735, partial [Nitrospira sp.]
MTRKATVALTSRMSANHFRIVPTVVNAFSGIVYIPDLGYYECYEIASEVPRYPTRSRHLGTEALQQRSRRDGAGARK